MTPTAPPPSPPTPGAYLAETYDGSTLRLYVNGTQVGSVAHTGSIADLHQPAADRRRQHLRTTLRRPDRRGARLQHCADRRPDPNRPGDADRRPARTRRRRWGRRALTATAVSGGEVDLSWAAATDNVGVTGYLVERCSGSGCSNFAQIGTTNGSTVSYKDTTVAASTSTATGFARPTPPPTSAPTPTPPPPPPPTPDTTPPAQPGTLSATAVVDRRGRPVWGASSDNVGVTGYLVERCSGSGCSNFAQIGDHGRQHRHLQGHHGRRLDLYSYRVRAADAAGNLSSYSNTATATTPAPRGPSGLVAAFGFDEGSGTSVTDGRERQHRDDRERDLGRAGKFGKALQFNGTSARVNVPDAASLHLTTAMTLEAWVNPSTVNYELADVDLQGQRQLLPRGHLRPMPPSPMPVLIAGGTYRRCLRDRPSCRRTPGASGQDVRRQHRPLYVNGTQVGSVADTSRSRPRRTS